MLQTMMTEATTNKKTYLKVNFINVENKEYDFQVLELTDLQAFELWDDFNLNPNTGRLIRLGETEKET